MPTIWSGRNRRGFQADFGNGIDRGNDVVVKDEPPFGGDLHVVASAMKLIWWPQQFSELAEGCRDETAESAVEFAVVQVIDIVQDAEAFVRRARFGDGRIDEREDGLANVRL